MNFVLSYNIPPVLWRHWDHNLILFHLKPAGWCVLGQSYLWYSHINITASQQSVTAAPRQLTAASKCFLKGSLPVAVLCVRAGGQTPIFSPCSSACSSSCSAAPLRAAAGPQAGQGNTESGGNRESPVEAPVYSGFVDPDEDKLSPAAFIWSIPLSLSLSPVRSAAADSGSANGIYRPLGDGPIRARKLHRGDGGREGVCVCVCANMT